MITLRELDLKKNTLYFDGEIIANGHWAFFKNEVWLKGEGTRVTLIGEGKPFKMTAIGKEDLAQTLINVMSPNSRENGVPLHRTPLQCDIGEGMTGRVYRSSVDYIAINDIYDKLVKGCKLKMSSPKEAISVFDSGDRFIGVVMPVRMDNDVLSLLVPCENLSLDVVSTTHQS